MHFSHSIEKNNGLSIHLLITRVSALSSAQHLIPDELIGFVANDCIQEGFQTLDVEVFGVDC
jgi:hypothetical protein